MKAQSVQRTLQSAIVMDLSDLEQEAGQIIAHAQTQATKILADAKTAALREAAKIREDARQAGHNEGLKTGADAGSKQGHDQALAQTTQKLAELTDQWTKTLDLFQRNMPVHIADAKTDLVRLALAIAEKVTHQEALRNKSVAQATVEDTFRLIGAARKVTLHVHPAELAMLEQYVPSLIAKLRSIESAELLPDESVTAGGCLVRFGSGQVDARLETQIQRIAAELLAGEE